MDFSKRLNRLMSIMGTNNNRLAMALNVDASLVSRWRTGSRTPKRIQNHAQSIAGYYIRIAQADYQRRALMELMGAGGEAPSDAELADMLSQWLTGGEEAQPAREPAVRTSADAARTVHLSVRGEEEKAGLFVEFLDRIERPDGGDVLLFIRSDETGLLEDGSYDRIYQTFRFVLLSGRRIRMVLQRSSELDWQEFAFRWIDLALWGDFTIETLDPAVVCTQGSLCLCDRMGLESLGGRILVCTDPDFVRLCRQRFEEIRGHAQSAFVPAEKEERRGTEGMRIHTMFRMPGNEEDAPEQQVLILPQLSFWEADRGEENGPAFRMRIAEVRSVLEYWQEKVGTDLSRDYRLYSVEHVHGMHWNSLDVSRDEGRFVISDPAASGRRIRVLDPDWEQVIRAFISDPSRFLQDRESIRLQLEAYAGRLMSLFGQDWNPETADGGVSIRIVTHPAYGLCTEWKGSEQEEPQYYRSSGDGILILKLSPDEEQARRMFSFLHDVSRIRDAGTFLLADPSGDRKAWDLALRFGFLPTGRLLRADGSGVSPEASGYGELRAEMKLDPREGQGSRSRG